VTVEIFTGSGKVTVANETVDELAQRLAGFGAPDAAERLLGHRSIRPEDKAVVREVLARWQRSAPKSFPPELTALQEQIGRDLWRALNSNKRSTAPKGFGF
jgi:hypothetical protein